MISKHLLNELNYIVIDSGVKMEGNLFYYHQTTPSDNLYEPFEKKRQNLQLLAKKFDNIVEIGFNAGHSAALMLEANPNLFLVSVDIGDHSYVASCGKAIQSAFPGRHQLIIKDSKLITEKEISFAQAVIVDGGHEFEDCSADLELCKTYCAPGTVIVIDDIDLNGVQAAYRKHSRNLSVWNDIETIYNQAFFKLKESD
jgi:predicted O-methyltransferase YrrM